MKSKRLLLTLLLALIVPWAAMAQSTLTVYQTESGTNNKVPFFGNWADVDQHIQMIYPADVLATMGDGATISQMVFYTDAWTSWSKDIEDLGTWTVKLGETTATTLSALDENTTLTEVFSDVLVCNSDHTTITFAFTSNYTYNGGNLLVDFTHEGADYIDITFLGKDNATSASIYQYDYYGTWTGGVQSFLPRVTFTHEGGFVNPCQKPTLAEATLTQGDGSVASLTWTENGEADGWTLQYGTDNTFATCTEVSTGFTISGSTITANLTSLTAEQKYYARVKPNCDTDGSKLSNVIDFTPTNAITYSVYDDPTKLINNDYVPIYSNWQDAKQQSEYIIPATELADITDGTIKAIKLYPNYNFTSTQTSWKVYVREVDETTFPSTSPQYYGLEGSTEVYSGGMSYTSADGLTINFNGTGYVYNGGNLLIGFYQGTGGNHLSGTFKGQNVDGASISAYGTNPPAQRNFIPKTTFSYLPCNTPKPRNLQVSNLAPTSATLSWDAPTTATPTGYGYQYKQSSVADWPTNWTNIEYTNVALSLNPYTDYDFRVRANYAEGESDPIETTFKTLASCAIPTNFVATTTPGQGTKATLSWVRGYDEETWLLEYALDEDFTQGLQQVTEGFIIDGNNITCKLTTLTPETHYYARVQSDCGEIGEGHVFSQFCFTDFTPTNYADYTYGLTASTTGNYLPFYGYYADNENTFGQYIIPATELDDITGGTIRSLTYYTSSTPNWGDATFFVYVKEVDYTTFASASASTVEDWTTMTQVYNGSLTVSDGTMTITFAEPYSYNGGNLMIGFKMGQTGSSSAASWASVGSYGDPYSGLYGYYPSWSSSVTYTRTYTYPKTTINYQPTAYPRVAEVTVGTVTGTSAQLSWTAPSDDVTGYKYQYRKAGQDWPAAWTSTTATSVNLATQPTTDYEFQVVALYGAVESAATTKSFSTPCPEAYPVPYTYDFESATPFTCWTVATGSSVTRKNGSSSAHGDTYYMCFNGSQTNEIAMPSFEAATNTLRLEYWVRPEDYTNSYCGSLAIGYYNASNEFVALKTYEFNTATSTYDGWEGNTYKKDIIDFDVAGVPADANIIFRQFNTVQNYWWYVDDVKVKLIPTCEDVDNVHVVDYTNHSATITWDAADGQTAWQIAYKGGANFDPTDAEALATATIVDVTENPYLFDMNLEAATTYYMYVRANCTASENGYGDWSDSYATFTTLEAAPAPYSFTASNIASEQVDLKWVAGGGDMEAGWDLYYVELTPTAPEAPTAETTPTKTVTTMPTPEAPYVLDGLSPETTYYIWVRSNYSWNNNTLHSDWVALEGNSFTTKHACPTPENVEASNITSVEALISWIGSLDVEEYTVEYGEEGTYSLNETEDFSAYTATTYNAAGSLPEGWKGYSTGSYKPHVSNNSVLGGSYDLDGFAGGQSSDNNFLYMIGNSTDTYSSYTILPQFSDLTAVSFDYGMEDASRGTLTVGYCTDNADGSTFTPFDDLTLTGSKNSVTVNLTATDIALLNANNGYLTFCWVYSSSYGVGIDNITIKGGTYTPGDVETKTTEEQQTIIDGLTPNKTYNVRVKSNCDGAEWSASASFTTLPDGTKVFKTTGEWSTAANWSPEGAPALNDEVILRADATIENGCVATAKKITTGNNILTIADGGQLMTDNTVTATVKKSITGYGAGNEANRANYYLIGNPLSSYIQYGSGVAATGMLTGNYDLYQWNYSATDGNEWRNYEASTFSLYNGTGYLYANEGDVELTFTGSVLANNTDVEKTSSYVSSNDYDFNGWSLFANPFVCDAYLNDAHADLAFYRMNPQTGADFIAATGAIAPMEGVFVLATAASQTFNFSRTETETSKSVLNVNVLNREGLLDRAIVRFNSDNTLEKFSFRENSTKVYIPMDGKDYAVVSAGQVGELPVSFKAENNGSYTLGFTNEEVSFSYLHLIDNLTGNDVDLLANPSYTFDAQTTDYASRFKLVFATGTSATDNTFGFVNGAGNFCIFGIEGDATVQVVDMLGHVLSSEQFSGSYETKLNVAPGVYMLRLINGSDVKVQKVIVR